ncbi:MAG: hypothetical protein LBO81_06050, partial [Clostridiales Family XIII bacterium]|nr:hypothetical protein [Clostridiales Family XIII bacterium]
YLTRSGCKYKKTVAELQFGQPFKTIEEIHAFLDSFPGSNAPAPEIPDPSDTAFPTPEDVPAIGDGFDPEKYALSAEERIIKTNRYDYPYYLPRSLNVAIFIVVK